MDVVTFYVHEEDGSETELQAPTDCGLSLMETLKGYDYPIKSTCGGMALCATCHIEVLSDNELPEQQDAELDMLDTVPNLTDNSRLACQLPIADNLDGLHLSILGDE